MKKLMTTEAGLFRDGQLAQEMQRAANLRGRVASMRLHCPGVIDMIATAMEAHRLQRAINLIIECRQDDPGYEDIVADLEHALDGRL